MQYWIDLKKIRELLIDYHLYSYLNGIAKNKSALASVDEFFVILGFESLRYSISLLLHVDMLFLFENESRENFPELYSSNSSNWCRILTFLNFDAFPWFKKWIVEERSVFIISCFLLLVLVIWSFVLLFMSVR